MEGTSTPRTRHLNYRYVIIALCFLMIMTSLGFVSSTKSLFPDEIAKELGVERSLVSIFESFRFVATVCMCAGVAPALFVFSGLMAGNLILFQFIISKSHKARLAENKAAIEVSIEEPIQS